jgi:hypothetical protein
MTLARRGPLDQYNRISSQDNTTGAVEHREPEPEIGFTVCKIASFAF